jgi:glutaredoxin
MGKQAFEGALYNINMRYLSNSPSILNSDRTPGRITIFSLTECPHCQRTKGALTERNIPYTEISLSTHPDKRTDMLSIANRLTVPQVFFNNKHIGGADDTIAVLATWDEEKAFATALDRYKHEIEAQPDPDDSRLAVPTTPPVAEKPPPPRDEEKSIQLPDGSMASVLEVMVKLEAILPMADLKHNLKIYTKAFNGVDSVNAIARAYDSSSQDALAFGKRLNDANIIHHVTDGHRYGKNLYYYRLHCHQRPDVLNSYRVWTERVDEDSMALVSRLKKLLGKIESAVTDKQGRVDYKSARKNENWHVFEEAVCELQGVDMGKMDENTKLAFGINVYNLMIKFAFMKVGIGTTTVNRGRFFSGVKMNIGGDIMSFNELENGVLRSNRRPPYSLYVPFSTWDKRHRLIVKEADCRIHFALNCGASSCPPVKNFTAVALEEELRIVALAFLEQEDNCRVDASSNTLHLNKILDWYGIDFAPSKKELPDNLVQFLRGEKREALEMMIASGPVTVKFNTYDWGTNASDFVPFDPSVLSANYISAWALF